ncbi:MAG TPA: MerR family transcriptional regulator [Chloroflexota bacterium]|nr:MerR family transcriptional regulator [Chloroflexota bacterium]
MKAQRWKIGELARATGVTVRTLHHYDAVGLLVPRERSEAGYRLYGEADVARLYRIRALRNLGLSLPQIAAALDGDGDLTALMTRHRDAIRQQIAGLRRLDAQVNRTLQAVMEAEDTANDLIHIMEEMAMTEKYYTDDQLAQLAARREALGEEGMRAAEEAWADVISGMEVERANGTPVDNPRVQELAGRWRDLIEQFTGGDEGILRSLQAMYREEGTEQPSRGMVSSELMEYVMKALEA